MKGREKENIKGRMRGVAIGWKEGEEWLAGEIVIGLLSYLWYDSILWFLILQILLIPYGFFLKLSHEKRRRREYEKGFYDFLQSLLPSLQAGYSLENACISAYQELTDLLGSQNAFVGQLGQVVHGIDVHISVEELFLEMAEYTKNEDIYQFSAILEILKYMGGNSIEVLKNSMERIQKKMDTAEEIRTLLSGKIYEKNVMLLMPFLMVFYLRITNPGYMNPLYHTMIGQILMTAILCGIVGCFFWTERIMKIAF